MQARKPLHAVLLYAYASDGSERRENITDWALGRFREHYGDGSITKWDIFYYVYGLLHHPAYRARFADNLKRELPRIPLAPSSPPGGQGAEPGVQGTVPGGQRAVPGGQRAVPGGQRTIPGGQPTVPEGQRTVPGGQRTVPEGQRTVRCPPRTVRGGSAMKVISQQPTTISEFTANSSPNYQEPSINGFWAFANAGKQLAELHLNYEQLDPHPLQFVESAGVPLSYRVEDKMRLSKDKSAITVNPSLTLAGIPPECFHYRLGNRSALEWVIDQYQVTTDKRSGIKSDPNRPDDEEYIVRLVGQVVRVSIETASIVGGLPTSFGDS